MRRDDSGLWGESKSVLVICRENAACAMRAECRHHSDRGKMIALPPRARILVVALRRLGDVLLTTPLIRSLKRAFPDAAIEALVFAGTEGILAGNPDLAGVIIMSPRPATGSLALARALWRQYDLAISTQSGDRPALFAWMAGRASGGPVAPKGGAAWLKRAALEYPGVTHEAKPVVEEVAEPTNAPRITPVLH